MAGTGRSVTVSGGPELSRAFKRMADRVEDYPDTVAPAAADVIMDRVLELVPVVSATLRSSIRIEETKYGASVLAGGFGVPYAEVIHFGWAARNIEPEPYMWDALDDRREEVTERYREQVAADVVRFDREAPP